ncbi:TonB-dependent siderophore receptor [Janthinobacterium sp. PC23-8]|nr:TonB-dependent siderophore receptor [Janthinobacterium sp. PC23-8]
MLTLEINRMPQPRFYCVPLTIVAAIAATLAAAPLQAQNAATFAIALPAQPLGSALNELARQASFQLMVHPDLVAGKHAPAVSGSLSAQQALERLLAGSGLQAAQEGRVVVVKPVPKAETVTLAGISVTASAERETPTGPVTGYVAKRSAAGSKTDTAIIDTPQSISVVTNDELRNRQAETLSQALNYTPGFTSQPTSFNRTADRFRIRGMDVESATSGSMRDGMRLQNNSYDGTQEPFGLERVEVLRGAASVLYGQLSPGGVINAVSKRPGSAPVREVQLQTGSHGRKQLAVDVGGRVPGSDTLDYRLTMLDRKSNTSQDYLNDDKLYLAPALTWRPNADTSLTVLSFYQKTATRFSAPLPYQLVEGVGTGPVRIGRGAFIGEPAYDKMNGDMHAIGYEFEHRFSDKVKVSHKLRYFEADVAWNYLQVQTTAAALRNASERGLLARQYSDRREQVRGIVSDTNVTSNWQLLGMEHAVLAGVDAYQTTYDSRNFRGNAPTLNLLTYNYGQPVTVNRARSVDRGSRIAILQKGIYLQDQVSLGETWTVLLGARHDWASQEQTLRRNGARLDKDDSATTWRAGLVYKTASGLAPYVSYSESFFPVTAAAANGQSFKPTGGRQYEAGVRYQPADSNMLLSAAVYELTQTNVLKYDAGNDVYRQAGQVRSKGLELEAKAELSRGASLIASYAYTDARTTRSTIASEIGQRSEDTPFHQAALWLDYSFASLGLPQLKTGAGARYKGSTQPSGMSRSMPAYTVLDAMLSYRLSRNWQLTANVSNLGNKQYTYCEFAICTYGDQRHATATLSYQW